MLRLSQPLGLIKVLLSSATERVRLTVLSNLLLQCRVVRTLLPILLELIRRARNFVLQRFASFAFLCIRDRSQEVTCCLAWRTVPAHINEVFLGLAAGAKEDLPTLIQNDHLIEDVVDSLRGLVDGDSMA